MDARLDSGALFSAGFAILGVVLFAACLTPAAAAAATACDKTAARLASACGLAVQEENKTAIANCLNISSRAGRADCRREAKATADEERALCREQRDARRDVCDLLGEQRYHPDPLLNDALSFVHPDHIPSVHAPNPFVSLAAGHTHVLRAAEDFEEIVVVHATDETREIQGVACRVVVDAGVVAEEDESSGAIEYVAEEVTDDWFTQSTAGDVYYCGELSRNFEDGVLDNLDGSFEAGRDQAKAGVLIRALPAVGEAHRQEFALGEAEDVAEYVDLAAVPGAAEGGENPAFPCAPQGCLKTSERSALEPEGSEFKYYVPGIGFVLAVALEDGEITGEREELVCTGDSLAILMDPACGIEDPEALLDALCEHASHAFCDV